MKRLFKGLARSIWRLTGPVRRPLRRKVDHYVSTMLCQALDDRVRNAVLPRLDQHHAVLGRLEVSLNQGRQAHEIHATDANVLLDSLVRELMRLQIQIEDLRSTVDEYQGEGSLRLHDEGRPNGAAKVG